MLIDAPGYDPGDDSPDAPPKDNAPGADASLLTPQTFDSLLKTVKRSR